MFWAVKQPDPALRAQLLDHARKVAIERGWHWLEPVEMTAVYPGAWEIRTNALSRGINVRMILRESDFAVLEAGYLLR